MKKYIFIGNSEMVIRKGTKDLACVKKHKDVIDVPESVKLNPALFVAYNEDNIKKYGLKILDKIVDKVSEKIKKKLED